MARQKVNVHKGKKSTITVMDDSITIDTDVRDSPFEDANDPTIKLSAVTKSVTDGSITIRLTGRGPHSTTRISTTGTDGELLVTLSDPTTGDPATGELAPIQTDVTYVNDPLAVKRPGHKPGKPKSGHKKPASKAKKPALKKR